ncbi:hypothetical protein [Antarcticimicrobium sediminis]|uniref:Acyltransferase family protein n=1 Tax=Antarcticimicrobium sediminis TaxID=2546227 RepID=A0A4V2Z6S5_9RHOB|nr:hypothetical protein [Antarcticimicrobium sediminis]TDE33716.1 hypothetical protein E1B25_20990 [Antarcticimicrobium sediminis]
MKTTSLTKIGPLETLQFLRFAAAGSVLLAHVSFFFHHLSDPDMRIMGEFAQGVALFSVISGFIVPLSPHTNTS